MSSTYFSRLDSQKSHRSRAGFIPFEVRRRWRLPLTAKSGGGLQAGFTLIEMLIVLAISAVMMVYVAGTFSRSRVDLTQEANGIIANIRKAQTYAVSAKTFPSDPSLPPADWGTLRCGYGIHYLNSQTLQIYAGANAQSVNCKTTDRKFGGGDIAIETIKITNPKAEFGAAFWDVFFEPPDPKTYTCDSACWTGVSCDSACSSLSRPPLSIVIRELGAVCPGVQCKTINVYTSGRIEIQ